MTHDEEIAALKAQLEALQSQLEASRERERVAVAAFAKMQTHLKAEGKRWRNDGVSVTAAYFDRLADTCWSEWRGAIGKPSNDDKPIHERERRSYLIGIWAMLTLIQEEKLPGLSSENAIIERLHQDYCDRKMPGLSTRKLKDVFRDAKALFNTIP